MSVRSSLGSLRSQDQDDSEHRMLQYLARRICKLFPASGGRLGARLQLHLFTGRLKLSPLPCRHAVLRARHAVLYYKPKSNASALVGGLLLLNARLQQCATARRIDLVMGVPVRHGAACASIVDHVRSFPRYARPLLGSSSAACQSLVVL